MKDQPYSYVYFIKPVGMPGPIKIGWATSPEVRIASLLHSSPFPLEIAARLAGTKKLESDLHRYFAEHHSHGEWFHPADELTSAIERIQDGENLLDIVDRARWGIPGKLKAIKAAQAKRSPQREVFLSRHRKLWTAFARFNRGVGTGHQVQPPFDVLTTLTAWERRICLDAPMPAPSNQELRRLHEVTLSPERFGVPIIVSQRQTPAKPAEAA